MRPLPPPSPYRPWLVYQRGEYVSRSATKYYAEMRIDHWLACPDMYGDGPYEVLWDSRVPRC